MWFSGIVTRCGAMVVWCGVVRPETMVWCGVVWCGVVAVVAEGRWLYPVGRSVT